MKRISNIFYKDRVARWKNEEYNMNDERFFKKVSYILDNDFWSDQYRKFTIKQMAGRRKRIMLLLLKIPYNNG